jgi:hypothetical protein
MVASLFLQPETILNQPENEGKLHMTKVQNSSMRTAELCVIVISNDQKYRRSTLDR